MQHKFITLLLIFISQVVLAQPKVVTKIDSTNMMIGEHMNMEFRVEHKPELEILMPKGLKLGGNIEVLSERDSTAEISKYKILTAKKVTITSFDSGTYVIPSIPIPVRKNGRWDTIFSKAMQLTVVSPTIDSTKDFAPIKEIFEEPVSFKEDILPGVLVVLGVALLVTLIWFISKRKKQQNDIQPSIAVEKPKTPAHITAFLQLKRLEDKQLWQKGDFKMYHSEISRIIREYLENRFEINALESVTHEIMSDVNDFGIESKQIQQLENTLLIADLVKFAKVEPSETEHRQAMELSLEFVRETHFEEEEIEADEMPKTENSN